MGTNVSLSWTVIRIFCVVSSTSSSNSVSSSKALLSKENPTQFSTIICKIYNEREKPTSTCQSQRVFGSFYTAIFLHRFASHLHLAIAAFEFLSVVFYFFLSRFSFHHHSPATDSQKRCSNWINATADVWHLICNLFMG